MTEVWNGAVYASCFGPSGSMIVFGGGHDDYLGYDVHAFDLMPPYNYDYVPYDRVGNNFLLSIGQTELGPNVKAAAIP